MKRREFITLLGGAAATWPVAASAQQPAMPVVAYLAASGEPSPDRLIAFRRGLTETGFVEGRNVVIEYHSAEGQYDRFPALLADLVHRKVAVIIANYPSMFAAKAATKTIPIVFQLGGDPVSYGLVDSLNKPGGNLTGVSGLLIEVAPKRLELLHEVVSSAKTFAFLANPNNPTTELQWHQMEAAARSLGIQLKPLYAGTEADFDAAFAAVRETGAGGLVIGIDPFLISASEKLATRAVRYAVPTVFQSREFAAAGGLMGYGGNRQELQRILGHYTGRILKGEKPADLPVQQATTMELVVNLRAAKALGLNVPLTLIGRADEVIE